MEKEVFNLSMLGYQDCFVLTPEGKVINTETGKEQKQDNKHIVSLRTAGGQWVRKSIKTLYRQAFNTEYCIDNITDFPQEEWKEIPNKEGKYYISTFGRVKSYCGYNAIIRKPEDNGSGYLRVNIGGKYRLIHLLMAETYFPEVDYKTEIHHKDLNPYNNRLSNLQQLTPAEHREVHRQLNKEQKVK